MGWPVEFVLIEGSAQAADPIITSGPADLYPDQTINVTGRVSGGGYVRVLVSAGGQYASGSGRLYDGSGAGRWSGRGSTSACSGHWEAERR